MNTDQYHTFLKALQVTAIKQASEPRDVKYAEFIPDYAVMDSKWLKKNKITNTVANAALCAVIFKAALRNLP